MLRDTVTLVTQDSLLAGEIRDSLNEVIGDILIDCSKKIAEVKLYARIDTFKVSYPDTQWVKTSDPIETVVLKIVGSLMAALPFWQNLIFLIVLLAFVVVIIKLKKDKQ